MKTYTLCSITFFEKRLWVNVEKRGRDKQATDDNIMRRKKNDLYAG
jgi:hypothetical protein